jgi:hypothetical protein
MIKKRGVLQLALQINFWIAKSNYKSQYLYTMNVNGQVAWVTQLQLPIYIVQLIGIQLQFNQNKLIFNYYATPL